jgi:hypothetical protein
MVYKLLQMNSPVWNQSPCFGIDTCVESPVDKLKIFNNIWSASKDEDTKHIAIYIEECLGDLFFLPRIYIGIVNSTSSTRRRVGNFFGVPFVPLFSDFLKQERAYVEGPSHWTKESGILYTVSSWSEIHDFILGSSN